MKHAPCNNFLSCLRKRPCLAGVLPPSLCIYHGIFFCLHLIFSFTFTGVFAIPFSGNFLLPFFYFFFASLHICIVHCDQWLGRFLSFYLPLPDFLEIFDLLMIPIFTFS